MLTIGTALDTGKVRKENQDALGVFNPPPGNNTRSPLIVVADGMGGPLGGAIASKLVISAMHDSYTNAELRKDSADLLLDGIFAAHNAILKKAMPRSLKMAYINASNKIKDIMAEINGEPPN